MHEFGITQNIVAIATDHAQGIPVTRVTLEIGMLSAVMAEAIRFCFDVCSQGTVLEGATLDIIEIPGRARCQDCGAETLIDQPFGLCESCDSSHLSIIAGEELRIKELEVAECV
jgi:hydrogenase nickel incorporation protein HypA/HybF